MKMTCQCGVTFRIDDKEPSKNQFRLCDEAELISITDLAMNISEDQTLTTADRRDSISEVSSLMSDCAINAVECPACRRLLILAGNKLVITFNREPPTPDNPYADGRPLWQTFKGLADRPKAKYGFEVSRAGDARRDLPPGGVRPLHPPDEWDAAVTQRRS